MAIWWLDSRAPHLPMDPPVIGRFFNGVGTFFCDSIVNGKDVRVRYVWSRVTPGSAHWEQAECGLCSRTKRSERASRDIGSPLHPAIRLAYP